MPTRLITWISGLTGSRSKRRNTPQPAAPAPYRAVAVVGGLDGCCNRAERLAGRRFLMDDPPPLPLPGCDQDKCTCRYVRYDDRRLGPRRSEEAGIGSTFVRAQERREESNDRRAAD